MADQKQETKAPEAKKSNLFKIKHGSFISGAQTIATGELVELDAKAAPELLRRGIVEVAE